MIAKLITWDATRGWPPPAFVLRAHEEFEIEGVKT
jgi:acetyl/propionyl-CoA carboxylase alpha subunit